MTTAIEICSNALVRLGAQPIQSFDEGTNIATACETIYNMKKKYALNAYPWRFSMKFAQLSRLTAAPAAAWDYQFTLPSDRIQDGPACVWTSDDTGDIPFRDYTLIGNKLLCNEKEIWVQYQYDVDEANFPPYFTELLVNIMAVELCFLVTDNNSLRQELKLETYGTPSEQGQGGLVAISRAIDSRDTPSVYISSNFLLGGRF